MNTASQHVQASPVNRLDHAAPSGVRRRTRGYRVYRAAGLIILLGLLPLSAGCLNPEFVNAKLGRLYPIAPGDEALVAVRIINDTTATLDVPIAYDDGSATHEYQITGLSPEVRETGFVIDWPVTRIALGDLDDPYLPAMTATFPDGSVSGVFFGQRALQRNVDYDRGDAILFHVNEDSRNPVYITVSVGIIDGAAQPAVYTRADPFEAIRLILAISGF